MKKLTYFLLFVCSPLLTSESQAVETSLFNDSASFTVAKAVKL